MTREACEVSVGGYTFFLRESEQEAMGRLFVRTEESVTFESQYKRFNPLYPYAPFDLSIIPSVHDAVRLSM